MTQGTGFTVICCRPDPAEPTAPAESPARRQRRTPTGAPTARGRPGRARRRPRRPGRARRCPRRLRRQPAALGRAAAGQGDRPVAHRRAARPATGRRRRRRPGGRGAQTAAQGAARAGGGGLCLTPPAHPGDRPVGPPAWRCRGRPGPLRRGRPGPAGQGRRRRRAGRRRLPRPGGRHRLRRRTPGAARRRAADQGRTRPGQGPGGDGQPAQVRRHRPPAQDHPGPGRADRHRADNRCPRWHPIPRGRWTGGPSTSTPNRCGCVRGLRCR